MMLHFPRSSFHKLWIFRCLLGLITVGLYGCTSPTENFKHFAAINGFQSTQISADDFHLQVFSNNLAGRHLNIYLDGCGGFTLHQTQHLEA